MNFGFKSVVASGAGGYRYETAAFNCGCTYTRFGGDEHRASRTRMRDNREHAFYNMYYRQTRNGLDIGARN